MKPEYDEAAVILNKGADVSFMTFACVYVCAACMFTGLCVLFIFHTPMNIQNYPGVAVPH